MAKGDLTFAVKADSAIASLAPGYFALVMGTGIVSIGLRDADLVLAARVLLIIAAVAYCVLAVMFAARAVRHRDMLRRDARNPEVAFSFFTTVAGTNVLAVGLRAEGFVNVASALIAIAGAMWIVLGYVLPWQVLMMRDGRPILARTNGTWFIWAVASQSLALALSGIDAPSDGIAALIGIATVMSWSVGSILYAGIAVLVILRVVHFGVTPQQFEPTYWVSMGAMAIAVVAGARIVDMDSVPMVDATRAFIGGTAAIFWCFAAWLVPMLVGAGVWRHVVHRVPLAYTPSMWSMVFPLGMFAVASMFLGRVEKLPVIEAFGSAFLAVAALVWALVMIGLVKALVRSLRRESADRDVVAGVRAHD